MPYVMYAIDKDGDGRVQSIGEFEEIEDIEIRVGHFAADVVINFEYVKPLSDESF